MKVGGQPRSAHQPTSAWSRDCSSTIPSACNLAAVGKTRGKHSNFMEQLGPIGFEGLRRGGMGMEGKY